MNVFYFGAGLAFLLIVGFVFMVRCFIRTVLLGKGGDVELLPQVEYERDILNNRVARQTWPRGWDDNANSRFQAREKGNNTRKANKGFRRSDGGLYETPLGIDNGEINSAGFIWTDDD